MTDHIKVAPDVSREQTYQTLLMVRNTAIRECISECLGIISQAKDDFRQHAEAVVALRDVERLFKLLQERKCQKCS